MYSIELQTIFYEYKNKDCKMNTNFVSPEGPKCSYKKKLLNVVNWWYPLYLQWTAIKLTSLKNILMLISDFY